MTRSALQGVPRNPHRVERGGKYSLVDEHEAALSVWMCGRLELALWRKGLDVSLGELGTDVPALLRPRLNIAKVDMR